MLQDTTQEKQVVGSSDPQSKICSNADEAWTTVEGEEELVVEETREDHLTISTDGSHNIIGSSNHPSTLLGAETDPTSGISDDHDLDRKDTESDEAMCGSDPALRELSLHLTGSSGHLTGSPGHSIEAVHGSDSVRSGQSESSTKYSDSREDFPIAVNPGKVRAIGDHFESGTETSPPTFHDPENPWEAQRINDKIKQAHATMDDIERHPEEYFRNPGSSFQVSARPKESPKIALNSEGDIPHRRKVLLAPDPSPLFDIEEGYTIERPKRRSSCCCIIM